MPYFPPAGGGGAPSGPAGGSLAGSYPNPTVAAGVITATEIAAQTITAAEIAPGTITDNELANGSVGSLELVDASVTTVKLGAGVTKVARTYWVATGGSDVTGDGSVARPFATVAAAVSLATTEVPVGGGSAGDGYVEIRLGPGAYTEDITLTRVKVILRGAGSLTGRGQATKITGQITINPTTGVSKFNQRIVLSNLMVVATGGETYAVKVTGAQQFGVDIDSCYLNASTTAAGPCLLADNTNASRCRINITSTIMNAEAAQHCAHIGGTTDLQAGSNVFFQASGASGASLRLSDSASALCDTCSFDHAGTGSAVELAGTQAGSFKVAISNSAFASAAGHGLDVQANGFALIMIRDVFTIPSGKNLINITAPATAVTYANSANIATPGTSTTKSAGVTSVPYTAV